MWWLYGPLEFVLSAVYIGTYILIRTAGDGRPWHARLRHPLF